MASCDRTKSLLPVIVVVLVCAISGLAAAVSSEFAAVKDKAESGDAEAQFALATIYELGVDVPKNYAESGKWYLKAANQGLAEAQFKLGVRYFEYGKQARENYTSAFSWFYKAANQGIAAAQYNVGLMYQLGRGVPTNRIEAYKWYKIGRAHV